ncbi:hypothetical protein [Aeromicrobium panaciterrae]|uniref:hypothetical protein n=1 Tax=Aeromicrobium panaciterrae TaxID=363861 RepID=UPI0031CE6D56
MTSPDPLPKAARTLLSVAGAVVAVEALAYVVLAVLDLTDVSSERLGLGVGAGILLGVYGAGQLYAAWRVTRGEGWARSPLIVTHLIQLLLAWNLRDGDTRWLAILMAVCAVIVLACLLAPPVNRALGRDMGAVRD